MVEALPVSQDEDLELTINDLLNGVMSQGIGKVEWDLKLILGQSIELIT